jgi:hypothetical protein
MAMAVPCAFEMPFLWRRRACRQRPESKRWSRKGIQIGAMSGACKLFKESLAPEIVQTLNKTGVAVVPFGFKSWG